MAEKKGRPKLPNLMFGAVIVFFSYGPAVFMGNLLYADTVSHDFRFGIFLVSFIVTFPIFLVSGVAYRRNPRLGVALHMTGVMVRLAVLFVIVVVLKVIGARQVQAAVILYSITVGWFLVFEVAWALFFRRFDRKMMNVG